MALYSRRRRKPEINIVPLMDVLTVLIFFILMSMQFKSQQTLLNITPPKVETAAKAPSEARQLVVAVDEKGTFFLNGKALPEDALQAALTDAGKASPDLPVLVLADENTPLKHATLIMDLARKAGLERIRLQTR